MIQGFACAETGKVFRAELARRLPPTIQRTARRKPLLVNAATELNQLLVPRAIDWRP